MPQPPPGKWFRLTPTLPPGAGPTDFETFPGGIRVRALGGHIHIPYLPAQDACSIGDFLIVCNGDGTYRGVSGPVNLEGSCVEISPPPP